MGLFFIPLVGLFMNRISGTLVLFAAAFCSLVSNVLLAFLRPGSNYFAWILPSLLLSTVGMDWTMNVGSVSSPFAKGLIRAEIFIIAVHSIEPSPEAPFHWWLATLDNGTAWSPARPDHHYCGMVIL